MSVETVKIACVDCGTMFEVSTEEQKWYEEKGFKLPKRCIKCRKSRRAKRGNKNESTEI